MVENHNCNSFSEAVVGGYDGLKMKIMIGTEVSWEQKYTWRSLLTEQRFWVCGITHQYIRLGNLTFSYHWSRDCYGNLHNARAPNMTKETGTIQSMMVKGVERERRIRGQDVHPELHPPHPPAFLLPWSWSCQEGWVCKRWEVTWSTRGASSFRWSLVLVRMGLLRDSLVS